MKKKILLLATLAIFTSVIATGTLAYYSAKDQAHNVITSGNVDIKLVETREDENGDLHPFENVSGVMPGQTISKIVRVANTGIGDAFVRVKLEKEIELASGSDADLSLISLDINETDWTKHTDGYYYYNHVLPAENPDCLTEPLFTKVEFHETMGNQYQNCKVIINVFAQATQVKNNGDSAIEANGWPASN